MFRHDETCICTTGPHTLQDKSIMRFWYDPVYFQKLSARSSKNKQGQYEASQ